MRPAAGVIGVVAHPIQGAWKGLQKTWAKNQEQSQRVTRISDGVEDVKNSTKVDRERILERWTELKKTTKKRQKECKEEAEKVMYDGRPADVGRKQDTTVASSSTDVPSATKFSSTQESRASQAAAGDEDDVLFERDLDIAKQLSFAEQRGYERGLATQLG
jgi:sterol 3beta-glucosyltransferase